MTGFYDLTVLHISDGTDIATAYISLSVDEETADIESGGFGLEVPMAYYPPGWAEGDAYDDVVLSITVDGEGTITNETYFAVDPDTGATGELYAEPEGIVVPQVLVVDAEGTVTWAPTSDVGLFADLPNLAYSFEPLESGTPIILTLEVTDFGDNTAEISASVEVP